MKQSDLYTHFAKCVKMVEDNGTAIPFRKMVKICGDVCEFTPQFDDKPELYTFAVGIIENTPVFVGDIIYHSNYGESVLTKVEKSAGIEYFYYAPKGKSSNNWNSSVGAFSLKDKNAIKLEDVKAFAIFVYDTSEVMVSPANYDSYGQKFILTGLNGSFGVAYSTSPKTQKEMYEYLIEPGYNGKGYIKTNKRFGLIED